jgi:amino acid transporter
MVKHSAARVVDCCLYLARRVLDERHITAIALVGTIGNGLFLGSGTSIAVAGPGGAVLAYALMGTVISAVISCLGEMTALMPVNTPMMEFPRRFLDTGIGFATGWMYWFAYVISAASQIVAASNVIKFQYNDLKYGGDTSLIWTTGEDVDSAVWITVFLIIVVLVNLFPVRYFGELQYVFGSIKIIFITLLIVMMIILETMQPRSDAYYHQPIGTSYWDSPYSFFNPIFKVQDSAGNTQREITGGTGRFLGVWTICVHVIFAYAGMDTVAIPAAESRTLGDPETMKLASRKISLRIVMLYTLAVFTGSFLVRTDHPFINGQETSVGDSSIFVIAVVEAGIPSAAHFFNAMFLFSALTSGTTDLYVSSRILHSLALQDQTGPEFITRRLRQCYNGVPVKAVFASAAMMLIGYMGTSGGPGQRLNEIASNCTVSYLILYAMICATYLCFFRTLQETREDANTSAAQAAKYDRSDPRYPYKSHGQWLKAYYGIASCVILLLFNGIVAFLEEPFDSRSFVASYISIPVFFLLIVAHKIWNHGFWLSEWGLERSNDLRNSTQTPNDLRRGRLDFPDEGFTLNNLKAFSYWIWVWLK